MGKEIKKGLIYAVITIIVSLLTSAIMLRGEAINKKADKEELQRVEQQSLKRDEELNKRMDRFEDAMLEMGKNFNQSLNDQRIEIKNDLKDYQDQIIDIVTKSR